MVDALLKGKIELGLFVVFLFVFFCAAAGLDLSRAEAVGSGRACQRPRTSNGAKCFSCAGALA